MLLSASLTVLSAVAALAATPDVSPLPPTQAKHYLTALSFRGLNEGRVNNYDLAGHGAALPGVHDFLRLVPPTPLAHGSLFSSSPLPSSEWIVELAFRIHGPPTTGLTEGMAEDGTVLKTARGPLKGGRGLAFWVTKEGLPMPVTISGKAGKIGSPPAYSPLSNDPSDPNVSLFGSREKFDGLGIVFDSAPTAPLLKRSDPRNLADHHESHQGIIGATGVVSGIMDDGSGGWLDKSGRIMKSTDEEAGYLERAVGECEAAFRNAAGLLWARVSYVNSTVRVDLDLSPHTTLSKAGRHYEHNCFNLENVVLPSNAYLGLSGLASGSTEPDSVDVYAMDVFEVLRLDQSAAGAPPPVDKDEPVEPKKGEEALEGTSADEIPTLTHEIFVSQARMVEAIDALARKIESLSNTVSQLARSGVGMAPPPRGAPPPPPSSAGSNIPEQRLASLDAQLTDLVVMVSTLRSEEAARAAEGESLTHLLQLQERMMEEVKSVGRRVDGATGQHSASLSTLTSRSAESLLLLKTASSALEASTAGFFASGGLSKIIYALIGVVGGVLLAAWREKRNRENDVWGQGGKKYF